jgi:dipeptidyl aminopeptidase/acylaminoacyl peptidase
VEDLSTGKNSVLNFDGNATAPRWAPDGTRLAFVGSRGDRSQLFLSDPKAGRTVALTLPDDRVQGTPAWSPDGATIAYTVVRSPQLGEVRRRTQRVFRSEGIGSIDGLTMSLQLIDVSSDTIRTLDVGLRIAMKPLFSPCGKRLLFLGADSAVGYVSFGGVKLLTCDLSTGRVTQVLGERWFIVAAQWSACGDRIVIAGDYDSRLSVPTAGVWIVEADGSNPQCRTRGFIGNVGLRAHHDMPTWATSQDNVLAVLDSAHAYATVMKRGCAEIWRVALDGPAQCEPVISGPRSCLIMDVSAATSKLLYAASDIQAPWELYSSDLDGGVERRITRLNDAVLAGWPPLRLEHLTFTSADGLPLEGWYLVRADRTGPQPTVLFVHGGPYLSTGHVFRFDLHLLAANGYAVVFANFRGSAGYGEPFVHGIMGDWGSRGFPDHMATVDAAIERDLADPTRLGVWGASHGGFATCWIVGHTRRFRAAVAESAVTNFATAYYLCDAPDVFAHELGGRPDEIPDVYRSRSPLTYASRCRTPTLMLHGEADDRCPIAEAEQFYRALHDTGCVTELLSIPGMTHMGDSTGPLAVRRAQNEGLLNWFERYL